MMPDAAAALVVPVAMRAVGVRQCRLAPHAVLAVHHVAGGLARGTRLARGQQLPAQPDQDHRRTDEQPGHDQDREDRQAQQAQRDPQQRVAWLARREQVAEGGELEVTDLHVGGMTIWLAEVSVGMRVNE